MKHLLLEHLSLTFFNTLCEIELSTHDTPVLVARHPKHMCSALTEQ